MIGSMAKPLQSTYIEDFQKKGPGVGAKFLHHLDMESVGVKGICTRTLLQCVIQFF